MVYFCFHIIGTVYISLKKKFIIGVLLKKENKYMYIALVIFSMHVSVPSNIHISKFVSRSFGTLSICYDNTVIAKMNYMHKYLCFK